MSQLDMFGPPPVPPVRRPTAEDARPKLAEVLDQLQTSSVMPLSQKDLLYWRTVFPQMSRWLPDEEREAMCAAFFAELKRLGRAAA